MRVGVFDLGFFAMTLGFVLGVVRVQLLNCSFLLTPYLCPPHRNLFIIHLTLLSRKRKLNTAVIFASVSFHPYLLRPIISSDINMLGRGSFLLFFFPS